MKPWTLGRKGYDRPVARRIVEEAGVPRDAFARHKKNTSHEAEILWPFSPGAAARYAKYLRDRGHRVPGPLGLRLIRYLAHAENLLHMNFLGKIGFRNRLRPWRRITGHSLVFQWANSELKEMYRDGLSMSEPQSRCTPAKDKARTEPAGICSGGPAPQPTGRCNRVDDAFAMGRRPEETSGSGNGTGHGGTFRLRPTVVPGWPKLAWVAKMRNGFHEIEVLCGPLVERGDDWIAEAVWAGPFIHGDFDKTDLVFGTGIRIRRNRTVFVTSGTVFDRLVFCQRGDSWHVSNSFRRFWRLRG